VDKYDCVTSPSRIVSMILRTKHVVSSDQEHIYISVDKTEASFMRQCLSKPSTMYSGVFCSLPFHI
jgi:hypothetical protein